MAPERFHLAWFQGHGFGVPNWSGLWGGSTGRDFFRPDYYLQFAKALERACFDYLIIEDSAYVPDGYGGTPEIYLKHAMSVPKGDPGVLAALMTSVTKRMGIVPTLSVTEYHPYVLARIISTLDHVSDGRAGWNIVTGSSDRAAQNVGRPKQIQHDLRYDWADEFTQIVKGLWDSWDPDAVVLDYENGVFANADKIHTIDFEGEYFSSRGPLNINRSPQGQPVLVQAGGSPRGRRFAAMNADTVIASAATVPEMKEYRDEVRAIAEANDRKPNDIKVLFLVSPTIGETVDEANAKKAREVAHHFAHPELGLAGMGFITDVDFSVYDVDKPLGELASQIATNGHQNNLARFLRDSDTKTLRQLANEPHSYEPVGTPETLADEMAEVMDEIGGDGFLFYLPDFDTRRVLEITDGLVPALQRRGLVRTAYTHDHFRDNLLEF